MRLKQVTKCQNCGRVLTSQTGERLMSANFDSAFPSFNSADRIQAEKKAGELTIWAQCDACLVLAQQLIN